MQDQSIMQTILGSTWVAESGLTWKLKSDEFSYPLAPGRKVNGRWYLIGTMDMTRNWGVWVTNAVLPLCCCVCLALVSHQLPTGAGMGMPRIALCLLALVSATQVFTRIQGALPPGKVTWLGSLCLGSILAMTLMTTAHCFIFGPASTTRYEAMERELAWRQFIGLGLLSPFWLFAIPTFIILLEAHSKVAWATQCGVSIVLFAIEVLVTWKLAIKACQATLERAQHELLAAKKQAKARRDWRRAVDHVNSTAGPAAPPVAPAAVVSPEAGLKAEMRTETVANPVYTPVPVAETSPAPALVNGIEEAELDKIIAESFARYDLDASGLICGQSELSQLVTHLFFKLNLSGGQPGCQDKVTKMLDQMSSADHLEVDLRSFSLWFKAGIKT